MDIFTLSPQIIAAIIANVGTVEGFKRKFPKIGSFLVSIIAGIVGAFGITPLTGNVLTIVQGVVFNAFLIVSASWLSYETVVFRFTRKQ